MYCYDNYEVAQHKNCFYKFINSFSKLNLLVKPITSMKDVHELVRTYEKCLDEEGCITPDVKAFPIGLLIHLYNKSTRMKHCDKLNDIKQKVRTDSFVSICMIPRKAPCRKDCSLGNTELLPPNRSL